MLKYVQAKRIFKVYRDIALMTGAPLSESYRRAVIAVQVETGLDFSWALGSKISNSMDSGSQDKQDMGFCDSAIVSDQMLTVKQLSVEFRLSSETEMNKQLAYLGLQRKFEDGWAVTREGHKISLPGLNKTRDRLWNREAVRRRILEYKPSA